MKLGYARISTSDQKLDMQIDSLIAHGVDPRYIYQDVSSGRKEARVEFDRMLDMLREGDEIVVYKLDRIARSVSHTCKLMDKFQKIGVSFRSISEPFLDTTSAQGTFVFQMFAAVAELEVNILRERTNCGLAAARSRGRLGGRPRGLSSASKEKARKTAKLYKAGRLSILEIRKILNIKSNATIYKYLKHEGVKLDNYNTGMGQPLSNEEIQHYKENI